MKRFSPIFLTLSLILTLTIAGCSGGNSDGGNPATSFSIDEVLVPGATSFPTRTDDSKIGTVNNPYYMSTYEVTYSLWKEVYDWAQSHGYTFTTNSGKPGGGYNETSGNEEFYSTGHDSDPVTYVNWYDAVVWCNALTEYYNAMNGKALSLVYKDAAGNVIKNSTDSTIMTYLSGLEVKNLNLSATGFRLPTNMEWELAARYKGSDSSNGAIEYPISSGKYWTPGSYASGATAAYTDSGATQAVAWYFDNSQVSSSPDIIYSTHPVGQEPLNGNALGLYDMSGNVWEWCFDKYNSSFRYQRGGGWYSSAEYLQVGYYQYGSLGNVVFDLGFRPVRTQ